jgi:hypothetical protein
MTKRYEKIRLNGEDFTLDTKETLHRCIIGFRDIYDCYGRPSATKVSIWHAWYNWFISNHGNCTIRSYNTNFFTIEGYVEDENGYLYYCYITASKNLCYRCYNSKLLEV